MFIKEKIDGIKFYKFQPVQILALGFAAVILIGSILLSLPIASRDGNPTDYIDALFTATSAVCVTGLVTVDTGTHYSLFGQIVIMLLIQIGGIGFMTFATLIALILGKKISLRERLIMQEAYNTFNIQGVVKLALYVIGITFSIELLGAVALSTQFIPKYGLLKGLYFGLFHAVSAFCNAGFDLIGNFQSLTPYVENTVVNLTVCALIIFGGIGFAVLTEVINYRKTKKLSLHAKVVLSATAFLIIIGMILFLVLEYNNPKTLGQLSMKGKLLASLFASVTPRTAGFNTISTSDMTTAGKFLTIILMFIGASPGSTGGGIKTSTAFLLFMTVVAVVQGKEDTEIYEKRINKSYVYRALGITMISFIIVIAVTMVLSIVQNGEFIEFLYEATSAFATVGLTLGLTTRLTLIGKIIIIITMYIGRVGPLTITMAIAHKQHTTTNLIKYPEDKILIG
ncbi:TrkH family potassium uptake protein [Thermobrachium celere]|uniref:Potassium uptake protein, integral membrane component, KtrB n=1 Tax=Thermobrachium celere DSM 8682 TaxID=941824 RepID=R7RT73_9CLOT|nr:TrkH family potassium uptake protein [Thermobrachium celere]CDF58473.1 Potassium uptake protein, integral membrane component, KtrB [Thermobrachium celere DSM 8682]